VTRQDLYALTLLIIHELSEMSSLFADQGYGPRLPWTKVTKYITIYIQNIFILT